MKWVFPQLHLFEQQATNMVDDISATQALVLLHQLLVIATPRASKHLWPDREFSSLSYKMG